MRRSDKWLLAALIALVIIAFWMIVNVIIDPDWYIGKTYGSEAEATLSQEEVLASINEEIFERAESRKAAHESYSRIAPPTTERPTETETEAPATTEAPTDPPTAAPTEPSTEASTVAQTPAPTPETVMSTGILHYSIDGTMMDPTLQDILYTTLRECGMEWWMPYAIAQARAESGAQYSPYAVSKDGKDKGLFQYREKYWAAKAARVGLYDADIFNPVNQIYVYCFEVSTRYKCGITDIGQLISAHKTSGIGYDAAYVDYVLGFVQRLKIER